MSSGSFPSGHPQIICPEEREVLWTIPEHNSYKGLIMCKIEPPANLFPPLLPYRSNSGVLLFPLCSICAESISFKKCEHSNLERQWWGGYTHYEV